MKKFGLIKVNVNLDLKNSNQQFKGFSLQI